MSDSESLIVHEDASILPVFGGREMRTGLTAYRELQTVLDDAMPDCIMRIGDKLFRKKSYWRAVAVAFKLDVQCIHEERVVENGGFVYRVTYRATASGGRHADGDGACASSEKQARQATEHNVRSHAHTRAFNRAVSNLVGFGEVSAEEVEMDSGAVVVAEAQQPKPPVSSPARTEPSFLQSSPGAYILRVREVKKKTAKNGTVYYEVYFLERLGSSDKDMASTFDEQHADVAMTAIRSRQPVSARLFEKDNGYWNIRQLSLVEE